MDVLRRNKIIDAGAGPLPTREECLEAAKVIEEDTGVWFEPLKGWDYE